MQKNKLLLGLLGSLIFAQSAFADNPVYQMLILRNQSAQVLSRQDITISPSRSIDIKWPKRLRSGHFYPTIAHLNSTEGRAKVHYGITEQAGSCEFEISLHYGTAQASITSDKGYVCQASHEGPAIVLTILEAPKPLIPFIPQPTPTTEDEE